MSEKQKATMGSSKFRKVVMIVVAAYSLSLSLALSIVVYLLMCVIGTEIPAAYLAIVVLCSWAVCNAVFRHFTLSKNKRRLVKYVHRKNDR